MIQKVATLGNLWLAASSQQHAHSCITSCAEVFGETSYYPHDSALLQPRIDSLWLSLFPRLKSPFKRNRFQTADEIQENTKGQLMVIGRIVWGSKVLTLEGNEVSLYYVHCSLYLVPSSVNVSIFHITWLDTFWTDLMYTFPRVGILNWGQSKAHCFT